MLLKFFKDWTLLIAMTAGALLYKYTGYISFLTPYLIFTMLLLTFAKLSPSDIKFSKFHGWLLFIQLAGSLTFYFLLRIFDAELAAGAMICVMAPTATSAAVITGMLGGNVAFLTTYTLISSVAVVFAAPAFFSFVGVHSDIPFLDSFLFIAKQLVPLLVLPLLIAWAIRRYSPSLQKIMLKINKASFYLWTVALMIVTGMTVNFLAEQENPQYKLEVWIGLTSLFICSGQFILGRYLGRRYNGDAVSAGQGLGQKNTILAIWMAQSYLNPVSSIAPALYVVWQNLINSYQLWKKQRNGRLE
ncbi:MAG: transporter [Rikenellaceae bacterium]|nr:transporter [Rikenellaceae bacterium]